MRVRLRSVGGLVAIAAASACASAASPPAKVHLAPAHAFGVPLEADAEPCPPEMARVEGFCVDRWEAHVVELDDDGHEQPHSPYLLVEGLRVRAKSAANVVPQAYISQIQAQGACAEAGKRLCSATEFVRACRGPSASDFYPYGGRVRQKGVCNEGKFSGVMVLFGNNPGGWTYANFNDPRLNHIEGGLAKTGEYATCVSPEGAFDMVGNLHEWIDAPRDKKNHGRFRGGSYGDAEVNGPGCQYVTSAHEPEYHDYSTGFRCCKDARPE